MSVCTCLPGLHNPCQAHGPERPKVAHYDYARVQPWDVIDAWGLDFYLGNVVKYVARHQHKGAAKQDLLKALDYLNAKIGRMP